MKVGRSVFGIYVIVKMVGVLFSAGLPVWSRKSGVGSLESEVGSRKRKAEEFFICGSAS